jgi:predicted RNA-binding Zn ribbon-like protein
MNTFRLGRDGPSDVLAEDLAEWLGPVPPAVVGRFRELRDALRRLAAESVTDDRPTATSPVDLATAVAVLNRACASAPAWSELTWSTSPSRAVRRTQNGPDGVLARIAEDAVELLAGERRADLRACHGPGCVRYFLRDHPRREWCSSSCGNRARVARHYHRHRGD